EVEGLSVRLWTQHSCSRAGRNFHFGRGTGAAVDGVTHFVCRALGLKFIFELSDKAQHWPCTRFSKGADGAALNILRDIQQVIGVLLPALAMGHTMQRLRHPKGSLAAGCALAAA